MTNESEQNITGQAEIEIVVTNTDREIDYYEMLDRVLQAIESFRDSVGADDVAEVVARTITLPIPEPTKVTIESRGQGRISVTIHKQHPKEDLVISYNGDGLTAQDVTNEEPFVAQPDLKGVQLASLISTILQTYFHSQTIN